MNDLAFPFRVDNGVDEPTIHTGLTKREYVATQLLAGALASGDVINDQSVAGVLHAADLLLDAASKQ